VSGRAVTQSVTQSIGQWVGLSNTHLSSTYNRMKKSMKCKVKEPATQQHIRIARLVKKKTLRNQYLQKWLAT